MNIDFIPYLHEVLRQTEINTLINPDQNVAWDHSLHSYPDTSLSSRVDLCKSLDKYA